MKQYKRNSQHEKVRALISENYQEQFEVNLEKELQLEGDIAWQKYRGMYDVDWDFRKDLSEDLSEFCYLEAYCRQDYDEYLVDKVERVLKEMRENDDLDDWENDNLVDYVNEHLDKYFPQELAYEQDKFGYPILVSPGENQLEVRRNEESPLIEMLRIRHNLPPNKRIVF